MSKAERHTDRPAVWLPQLRQRSGPLYLSIADAIAEAISGGDLQPGQRVPTHRMLADALGLDLTTITRAYGEARRRGLLEATVGRGTFVRARERADQEQERAGLAAGLTPRAEVDLGMNLPPALKPPLGDAIQRTLADLLARPEAAQLLTYRSGSGSVEERVAGAEWLRPTLGEVGPERVLVSPGAQPALLAVLGTVARPGDLVLVDEYTYPGIRGAAAQLGIALVGIASDADGMLPEALDEACCTGIPPKAVYCIPTIHNPTAVTMPTSRRQAIADAARRHGLLIIEDDAYGLLPSIPLPAIASLAPDITFHVATLSKVICPALRVAFLVAPDRARAARLHAALRGNVLMASPLLTALASRWISDGTAQTTLAAIRRECAARQAIARQVLPEGSFDSHPEGLHLWLRLPEQWRSLHFTAYLKRQEGPAGVPDEAFAATATKTSSWKGTAVRISLGAAADRESLRGALDVVAAALKEDAPLVISDVV